MIAKTIHQLNEKIKPRYWSFSLLALFFIYLSMPPAAIADTFSDNKNSSPFNHVEPPFWWQGMANSQLQIMFHGKQICHWRVELGNPRSKQLANLKSVEKTDNCNYLFVNLELKHNNASRAEASQPEKPQPEVLLLTFNDDQKGSKAFYRYPLKIREKDSANRKGFDAGDAIYLITPDRFANGNRKNDQVEGYSDKTNRTDPNARHGGDIAGIEQHLDYISELGFSQIWINPLLENKQGKSTYHGYATTDYYKIDPRFGSNNEYRSLIKKAKSHGLGIIQDIILNHCGSKHWWLSDLPAKDWINFDGQFVPTNHRRETILDPNASVYDKEHFASGWFVKSMPDLNQRNLLLANYLIQNNIWWIESAGLSGLRIDTYPYSDKAFLATFSQRIMQEYPNFSMVGEEWSPNPLQVAYWQTGSLRRDNYPTALNSLMDFPLQGSLVEALKKADSWNSGWQKLYATLATDYVYGDPNKLVVLADNHDMSRILTQLDGDMQLTKLALIFIATTRGIPQLYYGTEIAMQHPGTDQHGRLRMDYPGGWLADKQNGFSGIRLNAEQKQMQQFVKTLFGWRKSQADFFRKAQLIQFVPKNNVYVYFRVLKEKTGNKIVMIILNKSAKTEQLALAPFVEVLGSNVMESAAESLTIKDILSGKRFQLSKSIKLPAKQGLIFELKR